MQFKESTIQPGGRLSYGHYMAAGNITNSVTKTVYSGNDSTTSIGGDNGGGAQEEDTTGFYMFITKETETYNAQKIAIGTGITDSFQVVGYKAMNKVPTYVMDLEMCEVIENVSTGESSGITTPDNYGVIGLPESGMTFSVVNNGTTGTTVVLTINSAITSVQNAGVLTIPCNVIMSEGSDMGDDPVLWYNRKNKCQRIDFEFTWSVEGGEASSSYLLDLTNDSAGVNCDKNGNVLTGATKPTCEATLWFGTDVVSGATFTGSTPVAAAVSGLSVYTQNNKGVVSFDQQNFNFVGTTLEITVTAAYMGYTFSKIMSVSKNYPGIDGTGATTRWIVPSVSSVKVDPNNGTITPTGVTATVMMQVNDAEPEVDSSTPIYWGWDTQTPMSSYTGAIQVVAVHDYLALGLKNSGGTFYELETIPILENGANGQPGSSGQSVYRLDLSNENASINCDVNGNLLPGAVRPECTATLFYGQNEVSGAQYAFSDNYGTGITINASTGVITVGTGFTWNGTSIGIEVQGKDANNILRGVATFTLSKNYPGTDGSPAVAYWLAPSASSIRKDTSGITYPSEFDCEAYKQVGGDTPGKLASGQTPYIYWGYNTLSPTTRYSGQTITVDGSKNYVCFVLKSGTTVYDSETIPIVRDGIDGSQGQATKGAAIRGPVEWLPTAVRRWCSGTLNASGSSLEEDTQFIDIVFRMSGNTKVYYMCTTSYSQTGTTTWDAVSSCWTQTQDQYEFVASRVILADNAKIDFLTGNELYLTTQSGDTAIVTGGARSATTGATGALSIPSQRSEEPQRRCASSRGRRRTISPSRSWRESTVPFRSSSPRRTREVRISV